jgi:hypothetical protein
MIYYLYITYALEALQIPMESCKPKLGRNAGLHSPYIALTDRWPCQIIQPSQL